MELQLSGLKQPFNARAIIHESLDLFGNRCFQREDDSPLTENAIKQATDSPSVFLARQSGAQLAFVQFRLKGVDLAIHQGLNAGALGPLHAESL